MDIQERLTAFAMLGATWVMWLLVLLSVISIAIVLERTYYLFASRENLQNLREDFLRSLRRGDLSAVEKRLSGAKSFEARVVRAGVEAAVEGADSAEQRMAAESQLVKLHMERNLAFLGTVGNNAPFVGLLGTVIGVIRSFHQLDSTKGQVTSGLMADVGEALVATAIGILVALPAVAFFNLFQRIIRARLAQADALGKELIAYLKAKPGRMQPDAAE